VTEYETIRYEASDGLATITLARSEKRNAVNLTMFRELGDAATRAAEDADVRLVLVRGEGSSFCAGIDFTELSNQAGAGDQDVRDLGIQAQRPYRELALMAKPTLAAVQGHAVGAGFQLALACDLRVAADDASFAMLEVRYGLVPDLGGNHRLPRLVGTGLAKELVWTGRRVDAAEAERVGLVNRVVPAGRLADESEELARALAGGPPIPLRLAKDLIDGAFDRTLEEDLDKEREAQVACVASDDQKEAVAAFLEKRRARFTGR
jgi:enoyl-CoA hydratase/carnithine racemase